MIRKTAKHGSAFGKTLEKLVAIYTAPFFKGDFSILFALCQGNGLLFEKRLCDINQFDNRHLELKLKPMAAPVIQTFVAVYFENCLTLLSIGIHRKCETVTILVFSYVSLPAVLQLSF